MFLSEEESDFYNNLKNPTWRLNNLYYIVDKHGKKIKFKPNWAQDKILKNLWFFTIILKARQLGITTFFCLLYLDQILFKANKTAGIIAHTDGDTKKIFARIKYAWENLPPNLQESIGLPSTDSVGEMKFPNGSSIFVARSTRGSTLQYLHISEFAKICAKYPEKAREIVTGAINSVEKGNFISIESTAEGKEGYFAEYCMEAQQAEVEGKQLSELDFKYFFFPWWEEYSYRLKQGNTITKEYLDYFEKLEKVHNIILDIEQKNWYIAKKKKNDEDMYREYPSIWEEAFMAQIEGAYYAQQMQRVYEDNRIRNVPYDARFPVLVFWDIGYNDFTVLLFVQKVGNEIRFIDCYYNHNEDLRHYYNVMKEKPYVYGTNYLPHDGNVGSINDKKTRVDILRELGLRDIRVVERTKDVTEDIEKVRQLFSRFYFDEQKCQKLIEACQTYKKEWDDKLGQFKNSPKHDTASHFVSPIRTLSNIWRDFMIDESKVKTEILNFF